MRLTVSVVVTVNDDARRLADALASIAAQTRAPDQILLVHDDSSKGPAPVPVETVRAPRPGRAAARNLGATLARGEALAFLESSDLWSPGHLQTCLECLEENPEAGIAQGWTERTAKGGRPLESGTHPFPREQAPHFSVHPGSMVVRRSVCQQVGPWAEELPGDEDETDWLMRAWEIGVSKRQIAVTSLYQRQVPSTPPAAGMARLLRRHLARVRAAGGSTERSAGRVEWAAYRGTLPDLETPAHSVLTLWSHGRLQEARSILLEELARDPNLADRHKLLSHLLWEQGGPELALRHYGLSRLDGCPLPDRREDILAVTVIRNERERLPFFLSYYRQRGVARFFFVDNGSTDGSRDFLLAQPDVHLWLAEGSFNGANFGSAWFEVLLRAYGRDHWCLLVDADELLAVPPGALPGLCRKLEARGQRAMPAVLLDIYSDRALEDTPWGDDPLAACRYADRPFFHTRFEQAGPYQNQTLYFGGMRARVFGQVEFLLSKVPLVRYGTDLTLTGGQHFTNLPASLLAEETAALLHAKYVASFPEQAREQAARGEHYAQAQQYQVYARGLQDPGLTLYDPAVSVVWRDHLEELGFGFPAPAEATPPVLAIPASRRWGSVLLTVYRRLEWLPQALRSVLAQAGEELSVTVVQDGVEADLRQAAADLVAEIGQGRAAFVGAGEPLGQPEIFHHCLEKADGRWIHILHDDDWVEPGYYAALRRGAESSPEAGMLFCRHRYVDEQGRELRLSPLERDGAGDLADWLARIAVSCRLQTPAAMVRREVYETLGGFRREAGSAFDWDLWKRIAARFPTWYEPAVLANFREHGGALSHELIRSGRQLADAARSIRLSEELVGRALTRQARRYHVRYGLELVGRLRSKHPDGALANLREVLQLGADGDLLDDVREALA